MTLSAAATIGSFTWLLLIIRCSAFGTDWKFSIGGLFAVLLFYLPTVDVWAIWPEQTVKAHPDSCWPFIGIWFFAVLPVFVFLGEALWRISKRRKSNATKAGA